MNGKNTPTEYLGRSTGTEYPRIAPAPTRTSDKEEWTWMVDEDPAFYLSQGGRTENAGG
jgi:hypothetical protein